MFIHMRTTIRLNDSLLKQVKRKALEQNKTFTAAVEEALATWVQGGSVKRRKRFRIPTAGSGGLLPGVDINNNADLLDRMEGLI